MLLRRFIPSLVLIVAAPSLAQGVPDTGASAPSLTPPATQDEATRAGSALQVEGAPRSDIEIDFLVNYYDQDGDHSAVTGGVGSEDLQVIGPVFLVKWQMNDKWSLSGALGLDNITSASTDNIDAEVSSASRQDNRVFTQAQFTREVGDQRFGFLVGLSKEYDYQSQSFGLSWSRDWNSKNTTLAASLRHYMDTVDLFDIEGESQGEADRDTTDLSVSLSQLLGPRTVLSVELSHSVQEGFLSSPFQEVWLEDGAITAERLPDERERSAVGLRLNHAFTDRIVQRFYFRLYDDDFDVQAQSLELETHFRLPTRREMWIFPILRFHSQDGSSYFGLPGTFAPTDTFFTADRDLSEFDSEKFGLGLEVSAFGTGPWFAGVRDLEIRLTRYERDDGLEAINTSFGFGWNF